MKYLIASKKFFDSWNIGRYIINWLLFKNDFVLHGSKPLDEVSL